MNFLCVGEICGLVLFHVIFLFCVCDVDGF